MLWIQLSIQVSSHGPDSAKNLISSYDSIQLQNNIVFIDYFITNSMPNVIAFLFGYQGHMNYFPLTSKVIHDLF